MCMTLPASIIFDLEGSIEPEKYKDFKDQNTNSLFFIRMALLGGLFAFSSDLAMDSNVYKHKVQVRERIMVTGLLGPLGPRGMHSIMCNTEPKVGLL